MKIAVCGATGEVGRMMVRMLDELAIPVTSLRLFASKRSQGQPVIFRNETVYVEELTEEKMKESYDYILFSAGSSVAKQYAPIAAQHGNIIIDNSSAFRKQEEIPLIVPEINGDLLQNYRGIIANPNCSTIQMVVALAPLHTQYHLQKVIVSTYQSVSGAGNSGIQTMAMQRNGSSDKGKFQRMIDLNVIPQIGEITESGYCEEELKMNDETQKILRCRTLQVCATTVRVPVAYGHSETVYAHFEKEINLVDVANILTHSESVIYHQNDYVTPLEVVDSNDSHVSRLRIGLDKHSVTFWCVSNNVRIGAATNAVRILKKHAELNQ